MNDNNAVCNTLQEYLWKNIHSGKSRFRIGPHIVLDLRELSSDGAFLGCSGIVYWSKLESFIVFLFLFPYTQLEHDYLKFQ